MGSGGVVCMILIAWEPEKKKVRIQGKEYSCHSVYRLMQILQNMSYSSESTYWKRGDDDEHN